MRYGLPLLLLTGCYDFAGDREVLGFATNLVEPSTSDGWSPDLPIASRTTAVFQAVKRIGLTDEEEKALGDLNVQGEVRGLDEVWSDGTEIAVTATGRDRGVVRFRGELRDHFSVDFRPVDTLEFAHPLGVQTSLYPATDELTVITGTPLELVVVARSGGEAVGYAPTDLVVEGAALHGEKLKLVAGDTQLIHVDLFGVQAELPITVVDLDDVVDTIVVTLELELDDGVAILHQTLGLLDDGTQVWGVPSEVEGELIGPGLVVTD